MKTDRHLGAQSIEPLTLGFGSGHDLRVVRSSPTLGSTLSTELASDSLSLLLPLPLPLLSLSKINKQNPQKKEGKLKMCPHESRK